MYEISSTVHEDLMILAYFTHLSSSNLSFSGQNMSQSSAPLDSLSPPFFFYISSKQTHLELVWWRSPLQREYGQRL